MLSNTPELAGLGSVVINSGYTYNFWGTGTLNHQQTLLAQTPYYIVESIQFEPLTYYQGGSTIGTLWIETLEPSAQIFSLPVRFDATGIFFTPATTYVDLLVGTTFRFAQSLSLVNASLQP